MANTFDLDAVEIADLRILAETVKAWDGDAPSSDQLQLAEGTLKLLKLVEMLDDKIDDMKYEIADLKADLAHEKGDHQDCCG